MARPQLAACLLLGAVASCSGRSMLAHKPNSGSSLHAVALGPTNYYLTNGNGTWTTSLNPATSNASGYYYAQNPAYYSMTTGNSGAFNNATAYMATGSAPFFYFAEGPFNGVTSTFFPSKTLGVAVASAAANSAMPGILTTKDQGQSWQVVTGFSANPWTVGNTSAPGYGFPGYITTGAMVAPDLNAVTCVGQVCIAVGGYIPQSPSLTAQPAFGVVLTSNPTATYWTYQKLPAPAFISGLPLVVGALFGVAADSAGRHIYAVGAPAATLVQTQQITPGGLYGPVGNAGAESFGSIVYSGNYGASWVVQSAPALYNARYSLYGVTVVKGTVAFAVGGNEYVSATGSQTPGATSNGIIIATSNGGFSWYQQPLATSSVPYYPTNSATPAYGAFVNQTMPLIMGVATSAMMMPGQTVSNVTVWAAGCNGILLVANLGARNALLVNDGVHGAQAFFTPRFNPAYPAGLHLVGIVWDNNLVGYSWGAGIIISTHDGGNSWQLETPNMLVVSEAAAAGSALLSNYLISSIAMVPTTY